MVTICLEGDGSVRGWIQGFLHKEFELEVSCLPCSGLYIIAMRAFFVWNMCLVETADALCVSI